MIIRDNMTDLFQLIGRIGDPLVIASKTKDVSDQMLFDATKTACQRFVTYLYHKSKYTDKLISLEPMLLAYEARIFRGLGLDIHISNQSIRVVLNSTGIIQQIYLKCFPPESEEWKILEKIYPDLSNYKDRVESNIVLR